MSRVLAIVIALGIGVGLCISLLARIPPPASLQPTVTDSPQPMASGPRIDVPTVLDLGELTAHETKIVALTYRNVGNLPLEIYDVDTGCTCVASNIDKRHLDPGESGSCTLELLPGGFSGTEYRRTIRLLSNDSVAPDRSIALRGRMAPHLATSPAELMVHEVRVGHAWERELSVACTQADVTFRITELGTDLPDTRLIVVDRETVFEDESTFGQACDTHTVRVRHGPTNWLGERTGTIRIKTDHPRFADLQVPVSIRTVSAFDVSPRFLLFRRAHSSSGEAAEGTLSREVRIVAPVAVQLVPRETGPLQLEFALAPHAAANEFQLRCTIPPNAERAQQAKLVLDVAGYSHETAIEIPYAIVD